MTPINIQVSMSPGDFTQLCDDIQQWGGIDKWANVIEQGRFETYDQPEEISLKWGYAHWIEQAPAFLLARSYLDTIGKDYQVVIDLLHGDFPFVLLTDYPDPAS